jgi:hypothetical protein
MSGAHLGFLEPAEHPGGGDLDDILGARADTVRAENFFAPGVVDDLDQPLGLAPDAGGRVVVERRPAGFDLPSARPRLFFREADLADGGNREDRARKNAEVDFPLVAFDGVVRGELALVPGDRRVLVFSRGVAGRVDARVGDGLQKFVCFDGSSSSTLAGRPVASITWSAAKRAALDSISTSTVLSSAIRFTLAFVTTAMPASAAIFSSAARMSSSSAGAISGPDCRIVTFDPARASAKPYSRPMNPPPITTSRAGRVFKWISSSLVMPRSALGKTGRAGLEPVATMNFSPVILLPPPTSISSGPANRARPRRTAMPALARPSSLPLDQLATI